MISPSAFLIIQSTTGAPCSSAATSRITHFLLLSMRTRRKDRRIRKLIVITDSTQHVDRRFPSSHHPRRLLLTRRIAGLTSPDKRISGFVPQRSRAGGKPIPLGQTAGLLFQRGGGLPDSNSARAFCCVTRSISVAQKRPDRYLALLAHPGGGDFL